MNFLTVIISYSISGFNLFKSWVGFSDCFTVITSELFFTRRKADNNGKKYSFHV